VTTRPADGPPKESMVNQRVTLRFRVFLSPWMSKTLRVAGFSSSQMKLFKDQKEITRRSEMSDEDDISIERMDRIRSSILFDEWTDQIATGSLTEDGLKRLRARLDENQQEFFDGPEVIKMRLRMSDALADMLGIPYGDMPGIPQVPDSPESLA
jgi:hypothetical protein